VSPPEVPRPDEEPETAPLPEPPLPDPGDPTEPPLWDAGPQVEWESTTRGALDVEHVEEVRCPSM
jgi:hypothetical protein